jgi:hypothetical protein
MARQELLIEDQLIAHKLREVLTASRVEQRFVEQPLACSALPPAYITNP